MDYLTEQDVPTIKKECSKFISYINRYGLVLFRGENSVSLEYSIKRKSREGREPLLTPPDIHRSLNKMGKLIFGWPIRDGVMTSTFINFHPYHYFLPVNDYKYVFSPQIDDFHFDKGDELFKGFLKKYNMEVFYEFGHDKDQTIVSSYTGGKVPTKDFEEVCKLFLKKYYKESGLEKYIVSNSRMEVIFHTSHYYLLSDDLFYKSVKT